MDRDDLNERINGLPEANRVVLTRELASVLLSSPEDWRERRVESIAPVDENHYRDRISIQFTISPKHLWRALSHASGRLAGPPREGAHPGSPVAAQFADLDVASEDQVHRWHGQEISLTIPILTLPKQVLLTADVEDGNGHRVALYNRFQNSGFATYHVHTRHLEVAEDLIGSSLQIERLLPILRALVFSMPQGLMHRSNFRREVFAEGWLDRRWDRVGSCLRTYLNRYTAVPEELHEEIDRIGSKGVSVGRLLTRLTWAQLNGLRDPMTNPLLLFPDYLKVLREDLRERDAQTEVAVSASAELPGFLDLASGFLDLLAALSREPSVARRYGPLAGLSRFAHSWVAFAPMRVVLGEPTIVKVSQTIQVGQREETPLPTKAFFWFKSRILPFRGVQHTYRLNIEDGRGTHVEIVSPDSAAVRLVPSRTIVAIGPWRFRGRALRKLFGIEYSRSPDLQSFYTTKGRPEIDEVIESPQPLIQRLRRRVKRGRASDKSLEVANFRVVYKLRRPVATLYLIGTGLSGFVVWFIWKEWRRLLKPAEPGLVLPLSKEFGFVAAFTTLFTALLAARERASVAAGALTRLRALIFFSLAAILSGYALALKNGHLATP